ncbi:MAG TPA: ABC-F family ATP-binding cassette domain-containing protein [Microbacteriaceae bacterium]|nr:ABC-F family ATP-binding cassette domain-containing protein [Microbacteriaceae bacterium]HQX35120.1 ABC-F family ATP-binding cassette domain-containing protein [Microbacteriaceae bacterium]HQZ47270.1 ABC-F family ATP-binding cassette domain-containing protein [Microbacteriaceae bacterium]HRA08350.1 ABC-F family ATP-binding cassette domain-containing protein [Microbacteriaceae bacterium]
MAHARFSSSFTATGSHLRVDGLSFSYAGRRVLTDVSFVVPAGDRVGLIGENGSGKSTLLRVIAGSLSASAGTIDVNSADAGAAVVGLLHQEAPFSAAATIAECLETAVAAARRAVEAVSALGTAVANSPDDRQIADSYATALETADRLGAWEVDARVATVLNGLGLSGIDRDRATGTLSGGQRSRLALAWLLLRAPDVLLLDEPTNHLDDAATAYLVSVLKAWNGPLLIASHDREFLDETATSLLDLDPAPSQHAVAGPLIQDGSGTGNGVTRFTGNYRDYLAARVDERQRWERQYRDEQSELSRLRATVKEQQTVGHTDWRPRSEVRMAQKFYADRNAQVVSRRVNDARARLTELETRQIRKPPQELVFGGLTVAGTPRSAGAREPMLTTVNATVAGRLEATSISVNRNEKWLITGPNGSGKSTLLGMFAGLLEPSSGQLTRPLHDRVRLLTQETSLPDPFGRGPQRTAIDAYTDLVGIDLAEHVPLSTFGLIAGRDQNRPVQELSVGQQRRLALAILLADPPEVLLLDEPTNHLSLGLVTAIEGALAGYPGTVVIASHDRWLRNRWAGLQLTLSTAPASVNTELSRP